MLSSLLTRTQELKQGQRQSHQEQQRVNQRERLPDTQRARITRLIPRARRAWLTSTVTCQTQIGRRQ